MSLAVRNRRGAALALAIFALVAIAAIVHATVAPAIAHRRAVTRLAAFQRAEAGAERAVAMVLRDWPVARWRELSVGAVVRGPASVPAAGPSPEPVTTVDVTRLGATAFVIHASASAPDAALAAVARRVVFVELHADVVRPAPALTLGGGLTAGAADVIERRDACATDSALAPAVMVAPWSSVSWGSGDASATVVRDSAAARLGTYARPAGLDLDALRARADVHLGGATVVAPGPLVEDGRCMIGGSHWGEPLRGGTDAVGGCSGAYPVVVAPGDLVITGGRGQGILLVEGRLRIEGPFRFAGLIVAKGGIETAGGEVTLEGAVYAAPDAGAAFRAERTVVSASSCALRDLAAARAVLRVVPERAWGR